MSSLQGIFVPYLTDNVFRLSGIGSSSSLSELRQAVRRVDSGAKVGLRASVPMSSLLGDSEVENLPQLLQCLSADPVQRTAHRLLWFLHWTNNNTQSPCEVSPQTQTTSSPPRRTEIPAAIRDLLENVHLPDTVSQTQCEFLRFLLSFLLRKKPHHLEKTLQQYHQLCSVSDEYFVSLITSETKYSVERAQSILREAQQLVAEAVLNSAVDVALEMFSKQEVDSALRIVTLIVDSPMNDDWEDSALRRISLYTESLVQILEESTHSLTECELSYVNPYEKECGILLDLANRLKGRVTQAFRWETAVYNWRDQIEIAKANHIMACLNAHIDSLDRSSYRSEEENLAALLSIVDNLHEARNSLQTLSRREMSSRATNFIRQRINEIDTLLRGIENQIKQVLQIFVLQIAELKSLVLVLSTRNYVLRYEAKIEIQQRAERMLQFLNTVSRIQISEQCKTAAENIKRELETTCGQLGINARSWEPQSTTSSQPSPLDLTCFVIFIAAIVLIVVIWYITK